MLSKSIPLQSIANAQRMDFKTWEVTLLGPVRIVFIMDRKDREYVLRSNWKNFAKNAPGLVGVGFEDGLGEILGRGIFNVDGDEWADHRKVAAHLFSASCVFFSFFVELAWFRKG